MSKNEPNYVHADIIHRENINKEEMFCMTNRNEHYHVNPYNYHSITDKPTITNPQEIEKKRSKCRN